MSAILLDDNTMLVPATMSYAGRTGDGLRQIGKDDPDWTYWRQYAEDQTMKAMSVTDLDIGVLAKAFGDDNEGLKVHGASAEEVSVEASHGTYHIHRDAGGLNGFKHTASYVPKEGGQKQVLGSGTYDHAHDLVMGHHRGHKEYTRTTASGKQVHVAAKQGDPKPAEEKKEKPAAKEPEKPAAKPEAKTEQKPEPQKPAIKPAGAQKKAPAKQEVPQVNHKRAEDKGTFKLHDANPFDKETDGEEAHAAYEHVKKYDVKTKGDLYAALHQHTKDQYDGTDRQLHNITKQYYDHMVEHAGTAGEPEKPAAKEEPKKEKSPLGDGWKLSPKDERSAAYSYNDEYTVVHRGGKHEVTHTTQGRNKGLGTYDTADEAKHAVESHQKERQQHLKKLDGLKPGATVMAEVGKANMHGGATTKELFGRSTPGKDRVPAKVASVDRKTGKVQVERNGAKWLVDADELEEDNTSKEVDGVKRGQLMTDDQYQHKVAVSKIAPGTTVKVRGASGWKTARQDMQAEFIRMDGNNVVVRAKMPGKTRTMQHTFRYDEIELPKTEAKKPDVTIKPKTAHKVEGAGKASGGEKEPEKKVKVEPKTDKAGNTTEQLKAHLGKLSGNQRTLFGDTARKFLAGSTTREDIKSRAESAKKNGQQPLEEALRWLYSVHDKLKATQQKKEGGETRGPQMIGGKAPQSVATAGAGIYWSGDRANPPQKGKINKVEHGWASVEFEGGRTTKVPAQLAAQWMDEHKKRFGGAAKEAPAKPPGVTIKPKVKKSLALDLGGAVLKGSYRQEDLDAGSEEEEEEHGVSAKLATKLARDHLKKHPHYYDKERTHKALPKKDGVPQKPKEVKSAPKASSVKQGTGASKPRSTYPQEKMKTGQQAGGGQPDPVQVPGAPKTADPNALAQQLGMNVPTLQRIAQRFKDSPKLKGRSGFAGFFQSHAKAFSTKHHLDADYYGLIYDALTAAA